MLRRFTRPDHAPRPSAGPRPRPRTRLAVEGLEDRLAPAVTAVLNDGALTITGDSGDNLLQINELATVNSYEIQGLSSGDQTFNGVLSITVNLRQTGNDTVFVNGNAANTTGLSGKLLITGDGGLTVNVGDLVDLAGRLEVNHTGLSTLNVTVDGASVRLNDLLVNDGGGNATVNVLNGARLKSSASFTMGAGSNTVNFLSRARVGGFLSYVGTNDSDNVLLQNVVVIGNVAMVGGLGTNSINAQASTLNGSLTYSSTGPNDSVTLAAGTQLRSGLSVTDTALTGTTAVNITTGASVGGSVFFTGGDANESVQISDASVRGSISMNLAGGTGTLVLNSRAVLSGNLLHIGTGNTTFTIQSGAKVLGYVSLNTSGSSSVTAVSDTATIGEFFSAAAASGAGNATFTNTSVGSALALAMGTGAANLTVSGGHVTGHILHTGSGNVTLNLQNNARLDGGVTLNTAGSAALNVTATDVSLGRFFSAVSGTGADNITLNNVTVGGNVAMLLDQQANAVNLANTLNLTGVRLTGNLAVTSFGAANITTNGTSVGGAMSLATGSGNDTLALADLPVVGDFTLALGSGTDTVNVSNLDLEGNFRSDATGAATLNITNSTLQKDFRAGTPLVDGPVLTLNLTDSLIAGRLLSNTGNGADVFTLTNLTILGETRINTGLGADTIITNGVNFHGNFVVDMGGGADVLNVERTTTDDSRGTNFYALFIFQAGDENDQVNLGLDNDDLAVFFSSASFDGGGGLNTLDKAFAEFLGGTPTETNF